MIEENEELKVELIDGVAYLKNIKLPNDSTTMFKWLKEHPEQRLYLIEGKHKYGCHDITGDLVGFAYMPQEKTHNGFCINPFYKPLNDIITSESVAMYENPNETQNNATSPTESLNTQMIESLQQQLIETQTALNNCIAERDILAEVNTDYKSKLEQLINKNDCLIKDNEELVNRAKIAEEKLFDMNVNDNKIEPTDIRGLCKALYDLGFDVELGFVDNKE